MRDFCSVRPPLVISALLLTAAVALVVQFNSSGGFSLFFFNASSSEWKIARQSHAATSSSPSTLASPPPLSRAEEKRRRAKKRLSDAVEQVLAWRRRSDEGNNQKLQKIEESLAKARAYIAQPLLLNPNYNASSDHHDLDFVPKGDLYKNALAFHRSYMMMEKMFKVYVYEEGEPPIFHHGPCQSIYSMEGLFINFMERDVGFRTRKPEEAVVFFLPFSVVMIVGHLFDPVVRDKAVMERTVVDYVHAISNKYPYWNRSIGLDHFMLSCHDWGPRATWYHPLLYYHSIRVLCNANTSEFFNPKKDAPIPEINFPAGGITQLLNDQPGLNRSILAFFAGGMHGHIRPSLLRHWEEKDLDLRVYEKVPEGVSYTAMMKSSKYCLCPSGYEVASPRIVEAIYAECVPVLISQDYVLPFSDVLDWDSFAVRVRVEEIPDLKRILMEIPEERYLEMRENVKRVQKHFMVNDPPKRFDVFHMTLHSIWLRRLNVRIGG